LMLAALVYRLTHLLPPTGARSAVSPWISRRSTQVEPSDPTCLSRSTGERTRMLRSVATEPVNRQSLRENTQTRRDGQINRSRR
jgi:hypothetical protein